MAWRFRCSEAAEEEAEEETGEAAAEEETGATAEEEVARSWEWKH
jgi:hypothetical protein